MDLLKLSCVALTAGAIVSCSSAPRSSAPPQFGADAVVAVTTDSGKLRVDVRTSPAPPVRGSNAIELTITNTEDGTPCDGLDVQVEPWMPAMDHGTSTPTVTEAGGGNYVVTDVYLYMPGTWELRTTLSGALTDHAAPSLSVP